MRLAFTIAATDTTEELHAGRPCVFKWRGTGYRIVVGHIEGVLVAPLHTVHSLELIDGSSRRVIEVECSLVCGVEQAIDWTYCPYRYWEEILQFLLKNVESSRDKHFFICNILTKRGENSFKRRQGLFHRIFHHLLNSSPYDDERRRRAETTNISH